MENQLFSVSRFGNYLMKYFAEFRSLRLQFIILTACFTVIMSLSGGSVNFFSLSVAMFIFAIVSASSLTAFFTPRINKIKFLLVPASQFEKFLTMLVHLYLYIPVMFAVMLFVAQYCATLVTALFTLSIPQFTLPYAGVSIDTDLLGMYSLSYVGGVAFYLMGATIFTRHSFLKTTGLSLVLGFVVMLLMLVGVTFHALSSGAYSQLDAFNDVDSAAGTFIIVFSVLVSLMYLIIAYMRIAEMEVNETKK